MVLRTAVIGAGTVSENNHLPAVARNPRTDLVAVCDADESQARSAAGEYETTAYADADAMIGAESLDWVHVATPVQTHRDLVSKTVDAGIPTTVQKPATVTRDELDDLRARGDAADVPVSVVHNWLYYPVVRDLRRRIEDGDIGRVRAVETTFTGEGRPDETYRGEWVFDLPGGEFEEGMPHPLYLTLALGGDPRSADAVDVAARTNGEYDGDVAFDGTSVQWIADGGALCSVTFCAGGAPGQQIRVHGEDGSLYADLPGKTITRRDAGDGPFHFVEERLRRDAATVRSAVEGAVRTALHEGLDRIEERFDLHRGDSVDGHYALIDDAARAIERGEQPPFSLERSRWPMTMMERVREAANEVKSETPYR